MTDWNMESFLGLIVTLAWFAVVLWGAETLVIHAKRKKDWGKVGIAALSAATVAGPFLILMPNQVFLGINTLGLGTVLAIISGVAIFFSCTTAVRGPGASKTLKSQPPNHRRG
jgi:hypothetical protein